MLSRVADRLYWMARYLERAENTARMLSVHQALLLDLPKSAGIGWTPLLDILGCRADYEATHDNTEPAAVQLFIRADVNNPSSLLNSVNLARENARTTRDLLPTEAWRAVNELYLYVRDHAERTTGRSRHKELAQIVSRCQMIAGLLAGTMSQGAPYQFMRIGRNLERADMTTRLIDVAAAVLLSGRENLEPFNNTLWMAILKSLSGYQMYRQDVRRRVVGKSVMRYLLRDPLFPRATVHCLNEVKTSVAKLPRHAAAQAATESVLEYIATAKIGTDDLAAIHEFIDELQIQIANIHEQIRTTWLIPEEIT